MNHVTDSHFDELLERAMGHDTVARNLLMLRYGYHIQRRSRRLARKSRRSRAMVQATPARMDVFDSIRRAPGVAAFTR